MTEEERYQKLANERQAALDQSNQTYNDLYNRNTEYTNSVNQYLDNYKTTQNDIYDKQTQFQVDLQNQNKEKAEREYQKEAQASKNAYYDFINPYGVQAEIQAQNGLNRSGYAETTKSQAWTTQQNRTAQARAAMNEAKLQFDNTIKEAYLQNDKLKAELALKILEQQQQEVLRSFTYISDTKQNQLANNQSLDSDYNNRYNTLYSQIQEEKARQEAIRQWEAEMAFQKEQAAQAQANWEREYALSQYNAYNSGGNNKTGYTGEDSEPILQEQTSNNTGSSLPKITFKDPVIEAIKQKAANKTYSAKQSPASFSSKTAMNWYLSNINGKSFTKSQLNSLLSNALENKVIKSSDVKNITKLYGV